MPIRALFAVVVALVAVAVPSALAVPPVVMGDPALWLVSGSQPQLIPPAVPKVGETIESTWATFYCDPSCDPNSPEADPTVGNREIFPSGFGPPAGFKMTWERCADAEGHGCSVVQGPLSGSTASRYTVKDADAGAFIRSAVYATNLDCGYPRSYDNHQECRWQTRGVYSKLVAIPRTIVIQPATLPDGQAGVRYSVPIIATNGTGGYAFGTTGTLPPGLAYTGGALQGTPTLAGTYTFTITAAGTGANPGSRTYAVRIALGFPATTLAAGTTGVTYTQPLSVVGGNGAVSWTVSSGALPPGLRVEGSAIVGTPTQRGSFAFVLQATDAAGVSGTVARTIEVGWPTLRTLATRLAKATRAVRYRATLEITGGTAPYTVALTAGRLPRGLALRPDGVIAGKATERTRKKSFRFVVMVTDRYGAQTPIFFILPYAGR